MGKGLLLDTTLLETMRRDHGLFRFRRAEELELDVGGMEAGEAARIVAEHVERVVGGKDKRQPAVTTSLVSSGLPAVSFRLVHRHCKLSS